MYINLLWLFVDLYVYMQKYMHTILTSSMTFFYLYTLKIIAGLFWLCWIFVAGHGLLITVISLVVEHRL